MQVGRLGKAELPLKEDLPRCRREQIGAANNVRDAAIGIIDDDAQLIRVEAVGALDDEVTDVAREVLLLHALQTIAKADDRVVDADAPRALAVQCALRRNAITAGAGIHALAAAAERRRFEIAARARARVNGVRHFERRERVGVAIDARGLTRDCAVPFESILLERREDLALGVAAGARLVDVIDAQTPFAGVGARIGVARERGDQRTEVKRAGRRGRKPSTVANRSQNWLRSPITLSFPRSVLAVPRCTISDLAAGLRVLGLLASF